MEINGVAHTFICAGDFAAARAFYSELLPFLGLTCVADRPGIYYCVGGRTGFGIEAATLEHLERSVELLLGRLTAKGPIRNDRSF